MPPPRSCLAILRRNVPFLKGCGIGGLELTLGEVFSLHDGSTGAGLSGLVTVRANAPEQEVLDFFSSHYLLLPAVHAAQLRIDRALNTFTRLGKRAAKKLQLHGAVETDPELMRFLERVDRGVLFLDELASGRLLPTDAFPRPMVLHLAWQEQVPLDAPVALLQPSPGSPITRLFFYVISFLLLLLLKVACMLAFLSLSLSLSLVFVSNLQICW